MRTAISTQRVGAEAGGDGGSEGGGEWGEAVFSTSVVYNRVHLSGPRTIKE